MTISDESGGGPRLTGGRTMGEGVETPQVEGRMAWPIGLHSVEEEKKRKNKEEQRKRREEEEQRRLLKQQHQQDPQEQQR